MGLSKRSESARAFGWEGLPQIEALQSRRLFSAVAWDAVFGRIDAAGDGGDERIYCLQNLNGTYTCYIQDKATSVIKSSVTTDVGVSVNKVVVTGGDGDDTISGISSVPLDADGGAGHDEVLGGDVSDTLHGGADNDVIEGGAGTDSVYGDAGEDYINGGFGNDRVEGGTQDDILYGDNPFSEDYRDGNDTIICGSGLNLNEKA